MASSLIVENSQNEILNNASSHLNVLKTRLNFLMGINPELYDSINYKIVELESVLDSGIQRFTPIVFPEATYESGKIFSPMDLLEIINTQIGMEKKWEIDDYAFDNMPAYCQRIIKMANVEFTNPEDTYKVKAYCFTCDSRSGNEVHSMVVFTFPGKVLISFESDNPRVIKASNIRDSFIDNNDFAEAIKKYDEQAKALFHF